MFGLAAFYMEYLLVAFQCCSGIGRTGCEVRGSRASEEQNVRLFSLFECLLVCLYRVYKADPAGFGDTKPVT